MAVTYLQTKVQVICINASLSASALPGGGGAHWRGEKNLAVL
jgi:hypothetical protein